MSLEYKPFGEDFQSSGVLYCIKCVHTKGYIDMIPEEHRHDSCEIQEPITELYLDEYDLTLDERRTNIHEYHIL